MTPPTACVRWPSSGISGAGRPHPHWWDGGSQKRTVTHVGTQRNRDFTGSYANRLKARTVHFRWPYESRQVVGKMIRFAFPTGQNPASEYDSQWLIEATGGRYDVIREIAQGGMSSVLLAWDREANRHVALKVLSSNHARSVEGRERFRREALIIARAEHPHIVPCYDFICQGNGAVAVTQFIPGDSLADRLTGAPLDPAALLATLVPIADALDHVHRRGIVHRDVKPANILLREGDDQPFLIDFGIATLYTSDYSRWEVSQRLGTPEFMSPEQALGAWDADHRSDIYSLGLVAYAGLTGELPFQGNPLALAAQRAAFDVPPLRRRLPREMKSLAKVVDRCLARDPRRRWRSAAELSRALVREARRFAPAGSRAATLTSPYRPLWARIWTGLARRADAGTP